MFEIEFKLNGETQIVTALTEEQCDAILANGTFGVNALNLVEVRQYA